MTTTAPDPPVQLPEHLTAVRDALLVDLPDEPLVSRADLVALRDDLKQRVAPLATGLGDGVEIHVDRYALPAALSCPASAQRGEFEWSAPLAARTLGLPAVATMCHGGDADVAAAVAGSLAEAIDQQRSIGAWLSTLDPAGRAAVSMAAATWCARAWVAVPWTHLGTVRFGFDAVWHRPLGFGSAVVVRGRPDARVMLRQGRTTERVLLNLAMFDPAVVGLDALMEAFDTRRAPLRAVVVHAPSGRVDAVDVDVDLLRRAVDDVVAAVEAMVPAASGQPAAEVPGQRCWSCDRRDECATGTSWMAIQPRRVAGIPVTE
jgi:hypothetical protein